MADYDLVVLGGGPGGYAAALYAASTGLTVAMVEKEKVGGTCLHRGCIPAKALLHAAEVFRTVSHAGEHGVKVAGTPEPDWPAANKRKAGIVSTLHRGLSGLLKRRKVTVVEGFGTLTPDGAVSVDGQTLRGQGRDHLRGLGAAGHPRHGRRRRAGDHLRPVDQRPRPEAARAGRGDRRRRDRGRVRLGLHRPRRRHHAARGPPARRAADRARPRLRRRARQVAEEARHEDPRRGAGRHPRAHRPRRRRAVRDAEGLGEDRGRPGAGLDRPPPGQRGDGPRGGGRAGRPARVHRGRHEHHADLAAGRVRDRRLRQHPGARPRRLRRGRARCRPLPGRQPGAGRVRRCAVGGLHPPRGGVVGPDRGGRRGRRATTSSCTSTRSRATAGP